MAPLPSLSKGQVIGDDFRVERGVGETAKGALYVTEQQSTGRTRLLRLLPLEGRKHFAREALIGARIESEHVAEVVAAGVDVEAGFGWLALEHLDGEDLGLRLARRGRFERKEALEVLRQICHALGAAHARSIVHEKLEPASVFIAKSARADVAFTIKLLDFGMPNPGGEVTTFRAPEQLRGEEVSPATDVWALGLVAFEMLAGRSYWLSEGDALEGEIQGGISVAPHERGSVPEGFDAWLRKCCALEPRERFADAARAFAALVPVLEEPPKTDDVKRSRLIVTGLGLAAVAVGSAIGVAYALVQTIAVETSVSYGDLGSSAPVASSSPPEARRPPLDPLPLQVPSAQTLEPAPLNPWTYLGPPDAGTTAYLTLMCIPGCDSVSVDGKNLGPSPIVRAQLPPGVHGVVLRAARKKTVTLAVTLAPGQRHARRVLME